MSYPPKPDREYYDPLLYEEKLAQPGHFPSSLEPEPQPEKRPDQNLGYQEEGLEEEGENEQDKLDRETAWHHLANPAKPITPRHWELCRLLAMGHPHWKIKELMGYSRCYISVLSSHPKIREEVNRLQGVVFERTVEERFKQLNHRALDVVEEVIEGKDVDIKMQDRLRAATWLLEKTTGKAKQEIETKGGSLADFMTILRETAEQQKALAELPRAKPEEQGFIDVTPTTGNAALSDQDEFAKYLD